MAFSHRSIRPAIALGKQCPRSISSTTRQCQDPFSNNGNNANANIMNILSSSISRNPAPLEPTTRIQQTQAMARHIRQKNDAKTMELTQKRADYEQQLARKFKPGDVYAPHDLSGQEMNKWKKSRSYPKTDAIDLLGINPINEYKNFSLMSEYMSEMGRIKPATETGLRPVNQRKMAKAIRRAVGVRLMPSVHKHPELIVREMKDRR